MKIVNGLKRDKFSEYKTSDYLDSQEMIYEYLKITLKKKDKRLMMLALKNVFESKTFKRYLKK